MVALSFVASARAQQPRTKGFAAPPVPSKNKVEPLLWQALPPWLKLQFELRGRTEGHTGYSYKPGSDRVYELTRVYGAVEATPTAWLTGYAQFLDTHALGLPLRLVASYQRDVFDLRQGYLELHGKTGGLPVAVYGGRFELKFGNERVVGISDFTNNSRSWDGFKARVGGDRDSVTLFSTSVVNVHPSSLDDHGAGLTFHGAYAELRSVIPKANLEPFVLVRAVRGVTDAQGAKGNEVETTFGTEAEGDLTHGFSYDLLGDLQRGSYAGDSIRAGAGMAEVNYLLPRVRWTPRLGGEFDYASGNDQRNAFRHGTYDQQYPSNHNHFGLTDLFGFDNIRMERVDLNLSPHKNVTALIQGEFLNLPSRRDAVYSGLGTVQVAVPAGGFAHDDLGQEIDASAKYVLHEYWLAQVGVGHLFAGRALAEGGKGPDQTLGYFSLTYQFRVAGK